MLAAKITVESANSARLRALRAVKPGMQASAAPASLAPMVRLGTLPLRLLALERGAALVYSEEIVDTKLAQATRTTHARSGTVEWRLPSGAVLLSTCAAERGRLVVQLGSSCAEAALAAVAVLIDPTHPDRDGIVCHRGLEPWTSNPPRLAKLYTRSAAHTFGPHLGQVGIDLNMGCAKRNTTEHGAGFALFTDRERAEHTVRALRGFLPARVAVSCKVRLCDAGAQATAER
jgi:tRNA-dihydrouridine synthase